jgi:cellulose synthase/poly-beta-1,6-N-acetylglucosamine synthase-like glycosyltransferase
LLNILFDLFFLSFVQLVLATVLVLSPVREMGSHFRWTGSRITEVIVGGLWAAAITAVACLVTHEVWGQPLKDLATGGYALVVVSLIVMALRPDTNVIGQVFYAAYASAAVTFAVYAAFIAVVATTSVVEVFTASFVILLDVAAIVVWMSNVNYMSDVMCRARRSRALPEADPAYQPFVSLHIPAYNEPPELLIQTIQAVERIDYPNFEIIVIDNNTKDPTVWRPVEEYCRDRPRLKFIHVDPWPGYKAGACNLALRQYTDPRAEIIGLVDADDIVQPYYLRETAPYFSDPSIGFIQTFEGNRDFEGSAYYTACVDSFQAFYLTVMSSRNERDSVPFVGTMGLFRRSALAAVGGWNEWCICEDTEASLRVAKDGWSGLYIPRCFGRGVVPPSFAGMLTQRHRWCFGAMQILRLHWRSLMPWDRSPDNHLTSAQRRDYLMASLGWFRDLFMLAFSLLLLAVTGLLVVHSGVDVAPVDGHRSLLPMSLIIIATICMQWTLRHWTTMSVRRTLLSLVISLSVTWVVALACIEGVARKDGVFLRTSKASGRRSIPRALRLTRAEAILAAALFASTGLLLTLRDRPWLLIVIVFCQACVYLCGPVASVWNLWAQGVPREEFQRRFARQRLRAGRPLRRRGDQRVRGAGLAAARDRHSAIRRIAAGAAGLRDHPRLPEARPVTVRARPGLLPDNVGIPVDRDGARRAQIQHLVARAARRRPPGRRGRPADPPRQPGAALAGAQRPGRQRGRRHIRGGRRPLVLRAPVRRVRGHSPARLFRPGARCPCARGRPARRCHVQRAGGPQDRDHYPRGRPPRPCGQRSRAVAGSRARPRRAGLLHGLAATARRHLRWPGRGRHPCPHALCPDRH